MSVVEKVAYLKGLADGLGLDAETKEGKLFSAIIDTLEEMAEEIEELNDNALDIGDELDAISEDLAEVEDIVFGDECDDDCDCGCCDDDDYDFDDEDDCEISVVCPACNDELIIDESILELGQIECPNCGETLEFEFDEEDFVEDEE
ncbi:MAG: hypothetical protein E7456_03605 [Ruminococcaceae bacterium]|nr:hypothetical protein [Oscillospiraceae bacterium]